MESVIQEKEILAFIPKTYFRLLKNSFTRTTKYFTRISFKRRRCQSENKKTGFLWRI
jgi:hypothetical protein